MDKEKVMKQAFPKGYRHSLIVFSRFFHTKKDSSSLDIADLPKEMEREKERMLFYNIPQEIADKAMGYLVEEAKELAKKQEV